MTPEQHPVWILGTAYTGELNARLGIAERLGLPYRIVDISEVEHWIATGHAPGQPAICLGGTGEETTALVTALKRRLLPNLFTVFLASILPDRVDPGILEYDLIASPPHAELDGHASVITLTGVPHRLTREALERASIAWKSDLTSTRTTTGILLGGHTRYCQGFTPEYAVTLAERIRTALPADNELWITNSRRTPAEFLVTFLDCLEGMTKRFFDWEEQKNAYWGILARADRLVVTCDSVSMVCEAAFTGKPVYVVVDEDATEIYHRQAFDRLHSQGFVEPFAEPLPVPQENTPLDVAGDIVSVLRERVSTLPMPSVADSTHGA